MIIPVVYTPQHRRHAPDEIRVKNVFFYSHEVPDRVEIIRSALASSNIYTFCHPRDFGESPIAEVHLHEMISLLKEASLAVGQDEFPDALFPECYPIRSTTFQNNHIVARLGYFCHGPDSPIISGTWTAAYWSAQCALEAAQWLIEGSKITYALSRPPGHHASSDTFGGFCYLNNAAIAARHLQHSADNTGVKIAILDIDFHHGNGTQEIFYNDPSVLYCSLHVDPAIEYPYYWGSIQEKGKGAGIGTNFNWPLPRGTDNNHYLEALEEAVAIIKRYSPRYLIVDFGQDIAKDDPLGGFSISPEGFARIGSVIANLQLPTLVVQEGGYHLEKIGSSVTNFFAGFS